jgi:hypothetical protein
MLCIARSNPTSPRKRGEVSQTRAPIQLNVTRLRPYAAQHDPDRPCGPSRDEQDLTPGFCLTTLRAAQRISPPMSNAPHFDIDVSAFWADPYPAFARMRKQAPIAFVP